MQKVVDHFVIVVNRPATSADQRTGMASIKEQKRLAGKVVECAGDLVLGDARGLQAIEVAVRRQEVEAVMFVKDSVAREIHDAHIAVGYLMGEPVEPVLDGDRSRVMVN